MEKKYQWSKKLDNGEIYVVHADTINDLILDREEIIKFISRFEIDSVPMNKELEETNESFCTIHNVKMKERTSTRGRFYSHARELEPNSWDYCSGDGWKSEK